MISHNDDKICPGSVLVSVKYQKRIAPCMNFMGLSNAKSLTTVGGSQASGWWKVFNIQIKKWICSYMLKVVETYTHKWMMEVHTTSSHSIMMSCLLSCCAMFQPMRTGKTYIYVSLTHWGQDKMDAISQTTFWSALSWIKMFESRLKFHWSLILRVQVTIFQHWFR